jgi:ACS family allantoate permease-like MFS transporter
LIQNKRRAKKIAELGMSEEESRRQGLLNAEDDMTDFENIHFVYKV